MKRYIFFFGFYFVLLLVQAKAQLHSGKEPIYGCNIFRNKSPFAVKDSFVTFFLRGHLNAKKVVVTGSFFNWSTTKLLMTATDSGWIANIKLFPGGYLYKFITDGTWIIDPDNLQTETDTHGNVNSVYYHPNILFTFPFSRAKAVHLTGSFINWVAGQLPLIRSETEWQLPLYLPEGTHLYRFVADGKGYPDPGKDNYVINENNEKCSYILIGKPDNLYKAIHTARKTTGIRDPNYFKAAIADHYAYRGHRYMQQAGYANACQNFQNAALLYQRLQKFDSAASMFSNTANAYGRLSDFPRLLEYLQKALAAYEKAKNKYGVATMNREIGYYYADHSSKQTAIEYYQRALSLFEQLDKQAEAGQLLGNIGHMYLLMRDSSNSISYLQKALQLNQQVGTKDEIAYNFWILGDYYFRLASNIPVAIECLQKAQELFEQTGNKNGVAFILFNFADILLYAADSALKSAKIKVNEKYIRSIEYQKKGLAIIKDFEPEYAHIVHFLVLSETYEKMGLYDSAFSYFKQYLAFRDIVIGTEKQKEMVRLETRYQNEKNEDSLRLANQLTDQKLQRQILLARQQQQQLALFNKEKELQHLAYLKTQADLQNEQLTRQQKEKQLSLSEKEKALQSAAVKTLTQEKAIARLRQQRQWIYSGAIFILLAFIAAYFIYRWRIRSIKLEAQLVKEKSEQQQKEAEFQHKLADISLSALRSQMNPHFIFNCLNSIKLYTIQNDTASAAAYLSRFSKLIRLVLDNSRSERITLKSELAALELYIEMEAMRFKQKLRYTITVNENVETDYIELPPLLLQPYVENAIWHGLMHKEQGGQIDIKVEMKNEDSILEINITDDGIGRAKASELKNKIHNKHASYGMKATSERIALINQIYKTGANVVIHDLVDPDGQPAGTQVTIQIPV